MKIDPGIGKLLGVLSLQALPRRITLDFRDVFSEGFAFDEINGDVEIRNGIMNTDNLKFAGPAAAVSHHRQRRSRAGNAAARRARPAGAFHRRIRPVQRCCSSPIRSSARPWAPARSSRRRYSTTRSTRCSATTTTFPDPGQIRWLCAAMAVSRRPRRRHHQQARRRPNEREAYAMTGIFRVAAVQTVAGGNVADNLAQAGPLIAEAAGQGARLVLLPEYFGILGSRATDKLAAKEFDGAGPQQDFLSRDRARAWPLHDRRQRAARDRRSGTRPQRLPGLRSGRQSCRALRQDASLPLLSRRGRLRRDAHHRTRRPAGELRRALRPRRTVDLLRRALSGALPGLGRLRAAARARRIHGDDRRCALGAPAARARGREPVLCAGGRAGRSCTRTAGARGGARCSSIRGARSSRG